MVTGVSVASVRPGQLYHVADDPTLEYVVACVEPREGYSLIHTINVSDGRSLSPAMVKDGWRWIDKLLFDPNKR